MSVRMYAMTCGWLSMRFDFFIDGEQGMVVVPIPSYLIKHPKGTLLFDSGMSTELQSPDKAKVATALDTLAPHCDPKFVPGEEVSARLQASGTDPARIDYLVNSHLHFDHCGGNALIPNARWVVQKREWEAGKLPEGQAKNNFVPRHYDLGHDRIEANGEYDVFGDGSVTCVPTYGHTPGHQSLKVRLDDGDVVLTGDACYMRKSLEQMRLPIPMVVADAEQMMASFRKFKAFRDAGARLIFGHDPEQWKRLNSGPMKEITGKALNAEAATAAAAA